MGMDECSSVPSSGAVLGRRVGRAQLTLQRMEVQTPELFVKQTSKIKKKIIKKNISLKTSCTVSHLRKAMSFLWSRLCQHLTQSLDEGVELGMPHVML